MQDQTFTHFEKLLWVVCVLCSKAIRKILSVAKEHCKDEEAIKELSYTTAIIRLVLRCWTTFVGVDNILFWAGQHTLSFLQTS